LPTFAAVFYKLSRQNNIIEMESLVYLLPIFGVVGLVYMFFLQKWVAKQDAGDDKMQGIAKHIAEGAMAFLKAEYRILGIYVVVAGILLGWLSTQADTSHPLIVVAFVIGAFFSALAGNLGMRVATKANVRTTQAARTSLPQALKVSFNGGSVMGLGVLHEWLLRQRWHHCHEPCIGSARRFLPGR
jgi:K(+)-stimulated pyrophosphate-energized sodium pump